jgi:hypothetical protein
MSTAEKKKLLIASIARSMEAEGFSYRNVEKILKKRLVISKE